MTGLPAFHSWTPAEGGRQLYLVSPDDDGTGREVMLFALKVIDQPQFKRDIEQCLRADAEALRARVELALQHVHGEAPQAADRERARAA